MVSNFADVSELGVGYLIYFTDAEKRNFFCHRQKQISSSANAHRAPRCAFEVRARLPSRRLPSQKATHNEPVLSVSDQQ